jgi:hypothetical protein
MRFSTAHHLTPHAHLGLGGVGSESGTLEMSPGKDLKPAEVVCIHLPDRVDQIAV